MGGWNKERDRNRDGEEKERERGGLTYFTGTDPAYAQAGTQNSPPSSSFPPPSWVMRELVAGDSKE